MQPLRSLLVSYAFPPTGGAGVQRVLKLTKYLPEHGIQPTVLTVKNPSVPLEDPSLLRDVRADVEVFTARTFEPRYDVKRAAWSASANGGSTRAGFLKRQAVAVAKQLLVPDAQILWQPAAQWAVARRLASAEHDDVVFISGPPFSQFLLAPLTRLRPGVALVLDYRDEWSTYRETFEMMSPLAARVGQWLEPQLLALADAVTTATAAFRRELCARFSFLDPARVHPIENGYDPSDFPSERPEPPADRFVVTYAGTVLQQNSPRGLLGALRLLHAREPELAKQLEVRFIGRIVETELDAFVGSEALGVRRLGYVPHDQVIGELLASHLVLCLLDDVPGVERMYPGKIFELMHLGRPVLTLAPQGALTELVARHALGEIVPPRDEAAIALALERRLREFREGRYQTRASSVGVERYHRRALAAEFARVFRESVARAQHRSARTQRFLRWAPQ
jgi:glycosyltransferase involved in cell wall biosynthesis